MRSVLALTVSLLLGGCSMSTWYNPATGGKQGGVSSSVSAPAPVSSSDLASKTPAFREGYQDGCATAHGDYTKDSKRFNSDSQYQQGWFAGRSGCQNRS